MSQLTGILFPAIASLSPGSTFVIETRVGASIEAKGTNSRLADASEFLGDSAAYPSASASAPAAANHHFKVPVASAGKTSCCFNCPATREPIERITRLRNPSDFSSFKVT